MQRIETSDRNLLFVSGDVELNLCPVSTSNMSVLTTRLARIGRKPVNILGDGNCLFRSVSQLYRTESRHAQIRALAMQHLTRGTQRLHTSAPIEFRSCEIN